MTPCRCVSLQRSPSLFFSLFFFLVSLCLCLSPDLSLPRPLALSPSHPLALSKSSAVAPSLPCSIILACSFTLSYRSFMSFSACPLSCSLSLSQFLSLSLFLSPSPTPPTGFCLFYACSPVCFSSRFSSLSLWCVFSVSLSMSFVHVPFLLPFLSLPLPACAFALSLSCTIIISLPRTHTPWYLRWS